MRNARFPTAELLNRNHFQVFTGAARDALFVWHVGQKNILNERQKLYLQTLSSLLLPRRPRPHKLWPVNPFSLENRRYNTIYAFLQKSLNTICSGTQTWLRVWDYFLTYTALEHTKHTLPVQRESRQAHSCGVLFSLTSAAGACRSQVLTNIRP